MGLPVPMPALLPLQLPARHPSEQLRWELSHYVYEQRRHMSYNEGRLLVQVMAERLQRAPAAFVDALIHRWVKGESDDEYGTPIVVPDLLTPGAPPVQSLQALCCICVCRSPGIAKDANKVPRALLRMIDAGTVADDIILGIDTALGYYKMTLLEIAALDGCVGGVRVLLAMGANPSRTTPNANWGVLQYATTNSGHYEVTPEQHAEMVGMLLRSGASVTAGGPYCQLPLQYAADNDLTECARLLLESGATTNFRVGIDGRTPLGTAIQNGNFPMARMIVRHGGTVGSMTLLERTRSLRRAMKDAASDIVALLKEGIDQRYLFALK